MKVTNAVDHIGRVVGYLPGTTIPGLVGGFWAVSQWNDEVRLECALQRGCPSFLGVEFQEMGLHVGVVGLFCSLVGAGVTAVAMSLRGSSQTDG